MTKVSIVIPVYNVEAYLPACLESVLAQTLPDIEVICVDDASPDRCPQILDDYANIDSRVKVIHLARNSQQGYARNRGMELASGKYLYLLDSDDMITADAMEKLYDLAERERTGCIFFDSQVIYENETLARNNSNYPAARYGNYPEGPVSGNELFAAFIEQEEWTCYVQRQFWNMDFLRQNGIRFPEGHEHEDEVMPFAGLLLADRALYSPGKYFIRRYREQSVMTRPASGRDFYGYFRCFREMTAWVYDHGIQSQAAEINIARMHERTLRLYEQLKDRENLERYFRPEEKELYHLFVQSCRSEEYYQRLPGWMLDILGEYQYVYVYGAGVLGRTFARRLLQHELCFEGFLVSSRGSNPHYLLGRPVHAVDEVQLKDHAIAVIAVSKGYLQEIEVLLRRKNMPFVYYRRLSGKENVHD